MGNKQGKTREPIDPQFLRPSGLYPHTEYDERVLRRLILDRKLAPCYRGVEDPAPDREECPICMLFYPGGLNRSVCCKKPICTECYLQVTPRSSKNASCPYCKRANYAVDFRGPLSALEQQKLQSDEQRVIELQIESQVRQEKAYLERIAQHASGADAGAASTSAPIDLDSITTHESPVAASPPSFVGRSPLMEIGSPRLSCSPSRTTSLTTSPRFAPPIELGSADADDEYYRRWVAAQQRLDEEALAGSLSASPPPSQFMSPASQFTSPNLSYDHDTQPHAHGGGSDWESELDEFMLMEAIRLSLQEARQQEGGAALPPTDADAGGEDTQSGLITAQLAEQVERSIRSASRAGGVPSAMPEPLWLPPAMSTNSARNAGSAADASGAAAAASSQDSGTSEAATLAEAEAEVEAEAGAAIEVEAAAATAEGAEASGVDASERGGASASGPSGAAASSSCVAAREGGALLFGARLDGQSTACGGGAARRAAARGGDEQPHAERTDDDADDLLRSSSDSGVGDLELALALSLSLPSTHTANENADLDTANTDDNADSTTANHDSAHNNATDHNPASNTTANHDSAHNNATDHNPASNTTADNSATHANIAPHPSDALPVASTDSPSHPSAQLGVDGDGTSAPAESRAGVADLHLADSDVPNSCIPNSGVVKSGSPNSGLPNSGLPNSGLADSSADAPAVSACASSTSSPTTGGSTAPSHTHAQASTLSPSSMPAPFDAAACAPACAPAASAASSEEMGACGRAAAAAAPSELPYAQTSDIAPSDADDAAHATTGERAAAAATATAAAAAATATATVAAAAEEEEGKATETETAETETEAAEAVAGMMESYGDVEVGEGRGTCVRNTSSVGDLPRSAQSPRPPSSTCEPDSAGVNDTDSHDDLHTDSHTRTSTPSALSCTSPAASVARAG